MTWPWFARAGALNRAATRPDHPDPRLRGRRYAIPPTEVWTGAVAVAEGGMEGWAVTASNADDGRLTAEATTRIFRFVDDVEVRVSREDSRRTRVDLTSASRVGRSDLGANPRRIHRYLRRLDRWLETAGWDISPPPDAPAANV